MSFLSLVRTKPHAPEEMLCGDPRVLTSQHEQILEASVKSEVGIRAEARQARCNGTRSEVENQREERGKDRKGKIEYF